MTHAMASAMAHAKPPSEQRTSLADLYHMYSCVFCVVSTPDHGLDRDGFFERGEFGAPAKQIVEELPQQLRRGDHRCDGSSQDVTIVNLVDSIDSSSGDFCSSRVHAVAANEDVLTGAHDFSRDLHRAFPLIPEAKWSDSMRTAKAIEHSAWFCFWRGKVSGGLTSAFTAMRDRKMPEDELFDSFEGPCLSSAFHMQRTVVMLSVDGGPVTEVEKASLGDIARSVLSDLRRRKYRFATHCHILWVHFESVVDLVDSLHGERNLTVDREESFCFARDRFDVSLTYRAVPDSAPERGESLLAVEPSAILAEAKTSSGVSLDSLVAACRVDDAETVTYILGRMPELIDQMPELDLDANFPPMSPLMTAAWFGSVECMEVLIKEGADANRAYNGEFEDFAGATPLTFALIGWRTGIDPRRTASVLRILIREGASDDVEFHGEPFLRANQEKMAIFVQNSGPEHHPIPRCRNIEVYNDFLDGLKQIVNLQIAPAEVERDRMLARFKSADGDSNGYISREELRHVLLTVSQDLDEAQVELILKAADHNGDGILDYAEFLNWLCGGGNVASEAALTAALAN